MIPPEKKTILNRQTLSKKVHLFGHPTTHIKFGRTNRFNHK